jgi:lipopolysaccharide transport system ATP-binding protein
MYVRLAFAVAAHLEPEILIVDEVLAVGDFSFQKKCLGKMHDVAAGDGRTILFVSHNMAALLQLCDRGILLEKGMVTMVGSIQEVSKTYLASGRTQVSGQAVFPIEPNRSLQWISAEVLQEDNVPGTEFSCDEAIKVRLKLAIRKPLMNVLVDFGVDTQEGIRVLYGDCRDGDPTIVERLGVGLHTFEIRIPPRVLSSRTYSIAMAAYRPLDSQKDDDVREACVEFTVRDLISLNQNRPGLLGIILPWEHHRREGIGSALESGTVA